MFAFDRRLRHASSVAGALALIFGATAAASAGAWTLPQGEGQIIETLFGWTGYGAPWGGNPGVKQNRFDAQTYVQYGVADQLTIFGETALERYSLNPPDPSQYTGLDYSDLGLRARLWSSGAWVFSGEATVFVPGAHDPKSSAEAGNTGVAAEGRLLAGTNYAFGWATGFVDAELGYRLRTAGPPDEWHGDITAGLKLPYGIMLMLQDFTTVSSPSVNPGFPAWKSSVVEASVVYAFGDRWSIQIGVFSSVLAIKTNTARGAALALWRNF